MKGKVFVVILIGTAAFGLLRFNGYFDPRHVEIRGKLMPAGCLENTTDFLVVGVGDSSVKRLLNKKISAELPFHQSKLDTYVQGHRTQGDTAGFVMMGYPVARRKLHCSGATCFTVRRIKTQKEKTFTEL